MPHDFQERLVLSAQVQGDIISDEHLSRYELVKKYAAGKIVLDLACGSGYGAEILAKAGAAKVIAIDSSREAIDYAKKNFPRQNIDYREGNAEALDLAGRSIDVIASFETIEHLTDQHKYLSGLRRALKPEGLIFISTPNREASAGKNPFHVKEYNKREFAGLLKQYFPACLIFEQFNALASCLILVEGGSGKVFQTNKSQPAYFLAVCSLKDISPDLFKENIISLNPRALDNLYNNPAVRLVNSFYALLIKIPGFKRLFKKLR